MNILFLAQRVPYPPNKGDKTRSFHIIKHLSQRHQIALACLADSEEERDYARELQSYCSSIDVCLLPALHAKLRTLLYLFSPTPLTRPYFYSPALMRIVRQKVQAEPFDLMFVYCSSMAQYVEHVRHIPKVIDFVDVDSEKWAQYANYTGFPWTWIYRSESRRLRRYERKLVQTFQHSFLVSEQEVQDFRRLVSSDGALTGITNGVASDLYAPSSEPYTPNTLVFTGAMDYFANVETVRYFAHEILPLIRKTVPDVKFFIVGSNPAPELQELARTQPNIIVTGRVERVQPYVQKAAVFVAPMRIARGVQNKILETMAMGVPVVTNSLGFEGVSAVAGQDLFVEDQPAQFAQRVLQLFGDPELRRRIGQNARKTIETRYSWDANLTHMENILVDVSNGGIHPSKTI